jgi:uncharacterized lipoprotein YajG
MLLYICIQIKTTNKMKKLFVLFAAATLFVGVQACKQKEETTEATEEVTTEATVDTAAVAATVDTAAAAVVDTAAAAATPAH